LTSHVSIKPASPYPRIKVLHFITELSAGGAQTALVNLLVCLDRERFDLKVTCLYNGDGMAARRIAALGIPIVDLGMSGKFRLDAFWRLYRLLSRERPHILHTWMFHANLPGRLLGRAAGIHCIVSSERTMGQEGPLRRWLDLITASFTDRIICVSHEVARFAANVIGLPVGKLTVIPNGIDPARYASLPTQKLARLQYSLPEQAFIVGAIGRPRPVKGYPFLIEAFAEIAASHPNSCLMFVGDGPEKNRLMELAARFNLNRQVIFLPDQEDIPGLLPALDVLAIPSLYEGMPNVALEAMAAGLPVVASQVGGTCEVVVDGETGLLVPASDVKMLTAALLRLIDDPALRTRLGEAGRRRVCEHFSQESVCQKMEILYTDLLR
jgi:glycosyltransferase involved in cell wall biosynthesis